MSDKEKLPYIRHLFICSGKSCSKRGNPEEAKSFFKDRIKEHDLKAELRACTCSCLDHCDFGPNMVVYPEGVWYSAVQPADWDEIFDSHLLKGVPVERLRSEKRKDKP